MYDRSPIRTFILASSYRQQLWDGGEHRGIIARNFRIKLRLANFAFIILGPLFADTTLSMNCIFDHVNNQFDASMIDVDLPNGYCKKGHCASSSSVNSVQSASFVVAYSIADLRNLISGYCRNRGHIQRSLQASVSAPAGRITPG